MASQLDLEPLDPDEILELQKKAPPGPSSRTPLQEGLTAGGAIAQGVFDFLGAAPGVIGGTALAIGDVATGERPSIAMQGIGGAAHENPLNIGNWVPSKESYRQHPAYQYSPGTIAGRGIGKALEGYGKIGGWMSALTGIGEPEEQDAAMQIAVMAALPFARGSGAKPGSPAAMAEMNRPGSLRKQQAIRETYDKLDLEPIVEPRGTQLDLPFGPEGPMPRGVYSEEPPVVPPGIQGKFNLDPAEARRISDEIMQDVSGTFPSERQGQLFGQEPRRPYSPEEMVGRRFVMEEPQVGARDRAPSSDVERGLGEPTLGFRAGETETRAGYPFEQSKLDLEPIEVGPRDPFKGPGKSQAGAVDFGAFTGEAFDRLVRVLGSVPRNLEGAKQALEGKMNKMHETRDYTGIARVERMLNKVNDEIARQKSKETAEFEPYLDRYKTEKSVAEYFKWTEDINALNKQQEQARSGGDFAKVRELGQRINELTKEGPYTSEKIEAKVLPFRGPGRKQTGAIGDLSRGRQSVLEEIRDLEDQIRDAKNREERDVVRFLQSELADLKKELSQTDHIVERKTSPFRGPGKRERGSIGDDPLETARQKLWQAEEQLNKLNNQKRTQIRPSDMLDSELESAGAKVRQLSAEYNRLAEEQFNPFKGPGKKQTGGISFFDREVKKKGVVDALLDYKKQFNVDRRTMKELLEQEKDISDGSIKDLAEGDLSFRSRLDRKIKEGLSDAAIDKTMSILAAGKGPVGKLIKWTVDHRRAIDRERNLRVEAADKALNPWRDLRAKNVSELTEMKDKWLENIGEDRALTRQDFRTDAQWNAFDAIQQALANGLKRVNVARKAIGLDPINFIFNYFPSIRQGDYWVRIKDGQGNTKEAKAFDSIYQANRAYKVAVKEFGAKYIVEKPSIREKSQYDLDKGFAAFEETLKALPKDDPIAEQIQARFSYLLSRRGFAKTGIMRKGVPGAMGFETGREGIHNVETVLESYFKRQEAYISNIQKGQLQKQLSKLPREIQDKIPLAMEYMQDYLQASRGADLSKDQMLRIWVEGISSDVFGLNRSAGRQFLSDTSAVASLLWLATPKFLLSQIVQPLNALPKMAQIWGLDALAKNPLHAFFDGFKNALTPDSIAKEGHEWLKKNGYLEASIIGLLEGRMRDVKSENWKLLSEITKWSLGKVESKIVRSPVFHMFESQLRETIPNKTKRFETAAELMDYYMVHYDRESTPLMYNKFGYLGEAARPLKQYSHNTFGQFFEYALRAKNQKELTPLASLLGVQAAVGGMKGMIFIAEATAAVTLLNWMFNADIPTPEQLLIKSGIPDALIYGGWSTLLGRDVSSSLSAPSIPNMFSFPGVEFTADAVVAGATYLMKKMNGIATEQDEMKFALAVAPSAMRGWIEELYSRPGEPVPNPNSKMRGNYRRKDEYTELGGLATDRQIAKWMSLKSLDEAKANAMVREAKKVLMRDMQQRLSALDAISDRIVTGQTLDPKLIERYITEGGDPSKLGAAIKKRMIERSLTWPERQYMNKEITPSQAHKLDLIHEFLDRNEGELLGPQIRKQGTDTSPTIWKKVTANFETNLQMQNWMEGAKRLYPNDTQKQIEYVELQIKNLKKRGEGVDQRLKEIETGAYRKRPEINL